MRNIDELIKDTLVLYMIYYKKYKYNVSKLRTET